MMSHIYRITNLINGKIYVGKSLREDESYMGSGIQITAAIQKYGKENFAKDIIEECEEVNLDQREIFWIEKLDSRNPKIGYNISIGGTGGNHYWKTLDEDAKELHRSKIAKSKTGAVINYTDKQRKNVKESLEKFWEVKKTDKEWLKERAHPKKYLLTNGIEFRHIENITEYSKNNGFDKTWLCSIATGKKIYPNKGFYCFFETDEQTALNKITELQELQKQRKEQHRESCRNRKNGKNNTTNIR